MERTAPNSKISVTGKYLGAFFFVKVIALPVEPKSIEISLSQVSPYHLDITVQNGNSYGKCCHIYTLVSRQNFDTFL